MDKKSAIIYLSLMFVLIVFIAIFWDKNFTEFGVGVWMIVFAISQFYIWVDYLDNKHFIEKLEERWRKRAGKL